MKKELKKQISAFLKACDAEWARRQEAYRELKTLEEKQRAIHMMPDDSLRGFLEWLNKS